MSTKGTQYFTHDYNARNDLKLASLIADAGMEACGIYWCLVEMLYEECGYIKLTECERIAKVLRTQANAVRLVIDSDLFVKNEDCFYSPSVLKRLKLREEKSDKARASALAKHNKGANAERTLANAQRTPAIKGKERKYIKEVKEKTIESLSLEIKPKYPHLDFEHELDKFRIYWYEGKRNPPKNLKLALINWMDKASEFKKPKSTWGVV